MSKKFKPEYTSDDVIGLFRTRKDENDEGRLRTLIAQIRQYTRLEHDVYIPPEFRLLLGDRVVKTPFIRDAWHRIASSLVARPPLAHIEPKDDDRRDYRDAANIAERWDMANLERQSKEQGKDIIYESAAHHVRDGESVIKVVHRPDAWANFPERSDESADDYKKRAENYKKGVDLPIAWRVVDRQNIVYEGGEYGDQWVIEYGEYAKPFLKSRYGMKESLDGRLVNPKVSLEGKPRAEGLQASAGRSVKMEFFTSHEWHVIIDGTEAPGWPKANPYVPYLPYFRAPAYDMESPLYSLLFLVPRLDEVLTMKLNWGVVGAYPTPVFEYVPNSNAFPSMDGPLGNVGTTTDSPKTALRWSPGKAIDLPLGRTMRFLETPPVGKDLNDLALLLKSLVDVAGIPSILRGISGAGDSGYLGAQLRAAAEMLYKLSVMSLQRQMEKATEFTHWLVPNVIKQTVYVMGYSELNPKTGRPQVKAGKAWLGLSPDNQTKNIADVTKLGPVSFQYRPTMATDQQANAMIGSQLKAAGLASDAWIAEHLLQMEDWDSVRDEMAVERAMEEEPLKSMWVNQALEDAGLLPGKQNPAQELVGPNGQPLLPPGPGQLTPNGLPMQNAAPPGVPGIPGLTTPLSPVPPQGGAIPGNNGGRVGGSYPGQPGGPNL